MTIAGDCVTFDATRRRRYRARLADRLRRRGRAFIVEEGHIYLTVSCASTLVATSIVAPDASAANELKDDLAEQLLANTTIATEALGEAVVAVGVAAIGSPLLIPAPSPPPTPPATLPPSAPSIQPPVTPPPTSPLSSSDDRQENALDDSTTMTNLIIGVSVAGGIVITCILCCIAGYFIWKRRFERKLYWTPSLTPSDVVTVGPSAGAALSSAAHDVPWEERERPTKEGKKRLRGSAVELKFDPKDKFTPLPPPPQADDSDAVVSRAGQEAMTRI